MREGHHSQTADTVAVSRALHRLSGAPVVFDDPYAIHLTSPRLRHLATNPILRWLYDLVLGELTKVIGVVHARARFAEDLLAESMAAGLDQYVLVGAGMDSFAIRCELPPGFRVFELDHPATQALKRERLAEIDVKLPDGLEFVPVDFERETVAQALAKTTYSPERVAFFSWLGVVPYLTEEAIFDCVESMASVSAPGSPLVFEFGILREQVAAADQAVVKKLHRFTSRRGEPLISFFDPEDLIRRVSERGFELVQLLSPEEQNARYFAGRSDGLRAMPGAYLAHFRRSG
jgi:methyltransferase (TIGR00027 family)